MSARPAIVLGILAIHLLALWLIWRVPLPVEAEVDAFTSEIFFFEAPAIPTTGTAAAPLTVARPKHSASIPSAVAGAESVPATESSAITLPQPAAPPVDWSAQLAGAADATLEHQKVARQQLGALLRKFDIPDDPRDPHPAPTTGFRWYDAGIHRFDTRGPLAAVHINQRCVLVLLIFPACAIGHIEVHGDLFEGAAAAHDERIAAHRPNDVP